MKSVRKKILVTGGAGYIGSVLVNQLLLDNYRVTVLDSLDYGDRSVKAFFSNDNFDLVKGDIRNETDLKNSLDGVDVVIHLAAIVGEPACNKNPESAVDINKHGSEKLCSMSIERGVSKFIFASTCSNYGAVSTEGELVDETSPLQPLSVYSTTKVEFEKYLLSINEANFHPTCLRFATAYGLSFRPRFDLSVNEFCKQLFDKKKLEIYGENFWRPYCHTTDLAHACKIILESNSELTGNNVYNVGSTKENFQKKELLRLILQELPQAKELISYGSSAPDNRNYRVSFDKIKNDLNFMTTMKLQDGIKELISSLQSGFLDEYDESTFYNVKEEIN